MNLLSGAALFLCQAGVYVRPECEARIHNSQFKVAVKRFTATLSSNYGNHNETLRFLLNCGNAPIFLIGAIFHCKT